MPQLVIRNIGALYTVQSGDGGQASVMPMPDAELVIEDGRVSQAGQSNSGDKARAHRGHNPYPRPPEVTRPNPGVTVIDAHGALVTPGLVDPHTHILYGGDRASEMELKRAGVPYLEILARGGGILSTVESTRAASDEALFEATTHRAMTMLAQGTTTVEIKTGYGLSLPEELRALRILKELDDALCIDIVPTFLGAHAIPHEYRTRPDVYVDLVVDGMIPAVAEQGIARFCDVFCEPAVFSIHRSRRILEAARGHGMSRKIHADEISPPAGGVSGAELAAEVGAVSADHLRATDDMGFRRLRDAGVVPVVLPATSFSLRGHQYADARTMIDLFGLPVALATDGNPGTSPTESLQLVMTLAALELRMTPEEILAGVTINAARALSAQDRVGSLERGKLGDAVIWEAYSLDFLPYRFGANQAAMVVKRGRIVAQSDPI